MAKDTPTKKPVRRRTQAERREQTQNAILETAARILAEEGFAKFSSSGVAAQAGISRGALEHYYPKFIDLVAATCRFAMQNAIDEAREMADRIEETHDPIDAFLAASGSFFFAPGYLAQIEVMIAARSDPALAEQVNPIIFSARQTLDQIWTETVSRWGHSREKAAMLVEMSHFVLRGIFMADAWLPYEVKREQAVAHWRQMIEAYLRE
ncbi:TetR/AcrR family transcriptional regulator [uncultured Maritimibacter sp.]|uniref:TetR/AcrR family transcriptional regulator n=1 Tax=uncultured Maritimibacter sp. TaxID=991866 RepID=UPI002606D841|nr:TetR/AcrR family transcriptional regulator [uncultured Maritimibacter sp.]